MRGVHPPPGDATADYGVCLAALLPCTWGYPTLAGCFPCPTSLATAAGVETYADPALAALAGGCAHMPDEAAPDPSAAEAAFLERMAHQLSFWDVA